MDLVEHQTESLCAAAGICYLPLLWELQGGCTPETAFLRWLCTVAAVDVLDPAAVKVKARFTDQVAVVDGHVLVDELSGRL